MTSPTPRGVALRAGVGFVVVGTLLGTAIPLAGSASAADSDARFILTGFSAPVPVDEVPASATAPAVRAGKLALVRTIGYSVQGRKLTARLYGSPAASRVGVFIGSMHGSELGGIPVAKRLEKLGAPAGTAMWVIRDLNPDGSARHRRTNAHKVDLNRNSPHIWQPTARGPEYYPGPSAASEPETQAYTAFLQAVKPDVVLIYHQHGNGVDSYRQKNPSLTKGLAKRMKLKVKSFDCSGECTGTLTGWFNTTQQGAALTVELPAKVTTSAVKRWANAARWAIGSVPDVNQ